MNKLRRTLISAFALAATPVSLALRAQPAGDAGYSTLQHGAADRKPGQGRGGRVLLVRLHPLLQLRVRCSKPGCRNCRRTPISAASPRYSANRAGRTTRRSSMRSRRSGVLNKLHRPLFDAIHKDRLRTDNPAALDEWLAKNGLDPKKFDATMKSFGVQSKVKRAAPADRGRAHRRHARPDGAGPLHHQRRAGRVARRHAGQRRAPDSAGAQDPRRHEIAAPPRSAPRKPRGVRI